MIQLFLEAWSVQTWNWKLFYLMSAWFLLYVSYKIRRLEKQSEHPIIQQLDAMHRALEAGFEVRPKRFLK
jgi:hypothetical protein